MGKPKKSAISRRASVNRTYVDGDLILSRCPKCGSTDRTKYFRKAVHELPPHWHSDGKPATHVTYRYTRCQKCHAWRRDRSFENRC